ncbi:MAG: cobalamin-binding protein [Firmicutes bacterium]|nr:cobalamin-binding protein [Bacillota bacterium]
MLTKIRTKLAIVILVLTVFFSFAQAAPERIVSLAPSVTENLFALGAGAQVVGVTSMCNYPAEAGERVIIGDAFSINLELLLSLEPDLVIGDSTLVQGHLDQIAELGVPVFAVGPTNIREIQESLILLGDAVGRGPEGRELAEAMQLRLEQLAQKAVRPDRPRVFVEIWHDPLTTAGPGSYLDELIVLAGGENIAGDVENPWPLFSEELVIARDPQILILTGFNKEDVLQRPAWQGLTAIQEGSVYEVDPDLYARTTPRLLDALEELIRFLDGEQE